MAEPLNYVQSKKQDRSHARGRVTTIAARCVGGLFVAFAGLRLFCSGVGLDSEPWLASVEVCAQVGVVVMAIGVVRLRTMPPYRIGWTNVDVALLCPFFGMDAFYIAVEIISHPSHATGLDPGDLVEVAPCGFLIVMICLVVRINFINRKHRVGQQIGEGSSKVNQT